MANEKESVEPPKSETSPRDLLKIWEVISHRRGGYDSLMWQTPAMGMTAQAFLLTLALSGNTLSFGRIVAASLSAVISVMIIQLMLKHRRHEMLDTRLLESLEVKIGMDSALGANPNARKRYPKEFEDAVDVELGSLWLVGSSRLVRFKSFNVWCYGQAIFFIVGVGIIALEIFGNGGIF